MSLGLTTRKSRIASWGHDSHLFSQAGISPGQNLIHRDATQKPEVIEKLCGAQHHAA